LDPLIKSQLLSLPRFGCATALGTGHHSMRLGCLSTGLQLSGEGSRDVGLPGLAAPHDDTRMMDRQRIFLDPYVIEFDNRDAAGELRFNALVWSMPECSVTYTTGGGVADASCGSYSSS
jgi:hypothetical protein